MENIIYTLENRQLINMQKKLIRKAGNDDGIENSSENFYFFYIFSKTSFSRDGGNSNSFVFIQF